jgi:hypothetical protein
MRNLPTTVKAARIQFNLDFKLVGEKRKQGRQWKRVREHDNKPILNDGFHIPVDQIFRGL